MGRSSHPFTTMRSISVRMLTVMISTVLAVTIPLTMVSQQKTAYADTASELASAQAQVDSANTKLQDISGELNIASNELADIQSQQTDVAAQIVNTQQQVDEAQAQYDTAMDSLKKQAVQNYTSDQADYLSVLLSSTSFSDFSTRLYLLDKMMSQQKTTIDKVTAAKTELQAKQADLQSQKDQLDTLEASAQDKQDSIQKSLDEQESYLAGLSSQVTTLMAKQAAEQAAAQQAAAAAASSSKSSSSGSLVSTGNSGGSYSQSVYEDAANYALSKIGCSYVWAASGPNSFDCSGLVMCAYASAGVSLGHYSGGQYSSCVYHFYNSSELQVGDLIFYGSGGSRHVGIYVGGGMMVEAKSPSVGVTYNAVHTNDSDFAGFGRL
jgi:cell wall-associated NlpC family hydrolase